MSTSTRLACGGALAMALLAFCSNSQRTRGSAPGHSEAGQRLAHPRSESTELGDITASTGIHFQHLAAPDKKYIVESMSGGVALIDYDRDGWPDIYMTNALDVDMQLAGKKARSALFHNNRNGAFT